MSGENITSTIKREYYDVFSIKEYMKDSLIPKYFNNPEYVSFLNIGTFGLISEEIGNVTEDAFNTASVFLRESFPIKAQLPESIYAHAAVFQLDNFAVGARCRFLIALDFDTVVNNSHSTNTGNYFYLDKDTQIIIEDIIFTLDYDIEIKMIKREGYTDRYIFSAQYLLNEYRNSISDINNPYIPIQQVYMNQKPAILLPIVLGRQITRIVTDELIVNNTIINFPTFDITFDGKLAGIDVLYRKPDEDDYNTQLETRVMYSLPSTNPFCYYQLKSDNVVTISFTTRDTFFQPEFNSSIKVILYITEGKSGNFVEYDGDNIDIITTSEKYTYNNGCVIAARNLEGGAKGGRNRKTIDELQSITVENYSTATALTTDTDLNVYFKNYHYRYGTDILFIKKRDDMRERLYGGFYVIKDNDYIYPTNTLHLDININTFDHTDTDSYILKPGLLFEYIDGSSDTVKILNNNTKREENYKLYLEYLNDHPYRYEDQEQSDLPEYIQGPITYDEWKALTNTTDYYTIYDEEGSSHFDTLSSFVYTNPFLIVYRKNPSLIGLYLTISDQASALDFKVQNERAFIQWIATGFWMKREKTDLIYSSEYVFETRVVPSVSPSDGPILVYNDITSTSSNHLRIFVSIMDGTNESCTFEMTPVRDENGVYIFNATISTDDYITNTSKIHLINNISIIDTGNYDEIYVPLCDNIFRIYTLYDQYIEQRPVLDYNVYSELLQPSFKGAIESLSEYHVTNVFSTETNKMYFVKPLNLLRSTLTFLDYTQTDIMIGDCTIRSLPFIKYDIMLNNDKFSYLLQEFITQYENVNDIVSERLRNTSYIDLKFYNTYGKSKNFIIGNQDTFIDTVNLKITFDVWLIPGTNYQTSVSELKTAIKEYIENINKESGSNFYISNLIHHIEDEYGYVDHLRFLGINNYDPYYQSITNVTEDIEELSRDERRWYVPEMLNIEKDNIRLNVMTTA